MIYLSWKLCLSIVLLHFIWMDSLSIPLIWCFSLGSNVYPPSELMEELWVAIRFLKLATVVRHIRHLCPLVLYPLLIERSFVMKSKRAEPNFCERFGAEEGRQERYFMPERIRNNWRPQYFPLIFRQQTSAV